MFARIALPRERVSPVRHSTRPAESSLHGDLHLALVLEIKALRHFAEAPESPLRSQGNPVLKGHVSRLELLAEELIARGAAHVPSSQMAGADGEPYKRSRDALQRQCEEQKRLISQLEERCRDVNQLLLHRAKELGAMEEALFTVWCATGHTGPSRLSTLDPIDSKRQIKNFATATRFNPRAPLPETLPAHAADSDGGRGNNGASVSSLERSLLLSKQILSERIGGGAWGEGRGKGSGQRAVVSALNKKKKKKKWTVPHKG